MAFSDQALRIIATSTLAVNSAGGAATSISSVSAQTYAVDLTFGTVAIATSGVRFNISDRGATAVTSTTGALLLPNQTRRYAITPGQIVQAISADASTVASFSIVELAR